MRTVARPVDWRAFAGLLIMHALLDCFGGVWPIFKHLAGIPLGSAGMIATITTMSIWALQPIFGHWADNGHMRRLLLWGTILTFPMMLLGPLGDLYPQLGRLPSYTLMLMTLALARLGQAMFHPAGATLAGNIAPARRALVVSIFIAAGWAGYGFSQIIYSSTYFAAGGHTELALAPGLVLFLVAAWCYGKPHTMLRSQPHQLPRFQFGRLWESGLLTLFVVLCLSSALNQGLFFLLPEFLEEKHYPNWIVNGGGLAFIVAGAAIAMVPAGYLADRVGQRGVFIITLALSTAAYGALVMLPTLSLLQFALVSMAAGGLLSSVNPLGLAIGQRMAPGNMSLVGGVLMGLAWSVGSTSQWFVGWFASLPGHGPAGALAWLGVANALACLLAFALPRPRLIAAPAQA